MFDHGADDVGVRDIGAVEFRLFVFLFLGAQQLARRYPEELEQALELRLRGRGDQVFDDLGFDAAFREQFQRLARLGAARVVIDGDGHVTSRDRTDYIVTRFRAVFQKPQAHSG